MQSGSIAPPSVRLARLTGVLYLVIIVLGLFSEVGVRSRLVVRGDATATAENILASEFLFRLGFLSDVIVFLCDVAVAALFYVLLAPAGRVLSLVAAAFRLTGTALYGTNLLHMFAALLLLGGTASVSALDPEQRQALALLFLDIHRHGYDLGLLFFGVHCVVLGVLLYRSVSFPGILGVLMVLAAVAYLVGGFTLFLFPTATATVAPLYGLALVGEVSLCLWLLIKGVRTPA